MRYLCLVRLHPIAEVPDAPVRPLAVVVMRLTAADSTHKTLVLEYHNILAIMRVCHPRHLRYRITRHHQYRQVKPTIRQLFVGQRTYIHSRIARAQIHLLRRPQHRLFAVATPLIVKAVRSTGAHLIVRTATARLYRCRDAVYRVVCIAEVPFLRTVVGRQTDGNPLTYILLQMQPDGCPVFPGYRSK